MSLSSDVVIHRGRLGPAVIIPTTARNKGLNISRDAARHCSYERQQELGLDMPAFLRAKTPGDERLDRSQPYGKSDVEAHGWTRPMLPYFIVSSTYSCQGLISSLPIATYLAVPQKKKRIIAVYQLRDTVFLLEF